MNYDGFYDGYWENDEAIGQASFLFYDGNKYKGQWMNDRPNGTGIYIDNEGGIYEG